MDKGLPVRCFTVSSKRPMTGERGEALKCRRVEIDAISTEKKNSTERAVVTFSASASQNGIEPVVKMG